MAGREDVLVEKLKTLPADLLTEVEDFVDFVRMKASERQLTASFTQSAEPSFSRVWDNSLDAEYDKL